MGKKLVLLALLLSIAGTTPAISQDVNDFIDLFSGLAQTAINREATKAKWRELPSDERECIDQALALKGGNIKKLIRSGVLPTDPRLSKIRSDCESEPSTNVESDEDHVVDQATSSDRIVDQEPEQLGDSRRVEVAGPEEEKPYAEEPEEMLAQYLLRVARSRLYGTPMTYEFDPSTPCEISFVSKVEATTILNSDRAERKWDGTIIPDKYLLGRKETINLKHLDEGNFAVTPDYFKITFKPAVVDDYKFHAAYADNPGEWKEIELPPKESPPPKEPNWETDVACFLCSEEVKRQKIREAQAEWFRTVFSEWRNEEERRKQSYRGYLSDVKLTTSDLHLFLEDGQPPRLSVGDIIDYRNYKGEIMDSLQDPIKVLVPILKKLLAKCVARP